MNTPKKILLVEDDADDQEFFIEAISEVKNAKLYDIANNGQEALDKLENSPDLPDIIIMDINMPVMDGMECLAEIKKNPRIRNIPVVILSTAIAQMELACKLGAKAFFKKPDDWTTLRKKLEQIINLDFIVNNTRVDRAF